MLHKNTILNLFIKYLNNNEYEYKNITIIP